MSEIIRPSKDVYYCNIAKDVSKRGTCLRRNFGAVIVNDDQIISTGYTGAPRGVPNCIDLGKCLRQENNISPGKNYELCRSVHAEMNAIISASRRDMIGGKLYLYGESKENGKPYENTQPCMLCWRQIINAGLSKVIVQRGNEIIHLSIEERVRKMTENPFSEIEIK